MNITTTDLFLSSSIILTNMEETDSLEPGEMLAAILLAYVCETPCEWDNKRLPCKRIFPYGILAPPEECKEAARVTDHSKHPSLYHKFAKDAPDCSMLCFRVQYGEWDLWLLECKASGSTISEGDGGFWLLWNEQLVQAASSFLGFPVFRYYQHLFQGSSLEMNHEFLLGLKDTGRDAQSLWNCAQRMWRRLWDMYACCSNLWGYEDQCVMCTVPKTAEEYDDDPKEPVPIDFEFQRQLRND